MAAISDDVAKENGVKPEPPSSVPFWHPTLKGVRLRVTRQWAQMSEIPVLKMLHEVSVD